MKVGDKVRSLSNVGRIRTKGEIYEIVDIDSHQGVTGLWYIDNNNEKTFSDAINDFVVIKENPETIELDVWVYDKSLKDYLNGENLHDLNIFTELELNGDYEGYSKAKLIVEKPEEKKVTITESEFDRVYRKVMVMTTCLDEFKKELGF